MLRWWSPTLITRGTQISLIRVREIWGLAIAIIWCVPTCIIVHSRILINLVKFSYSWTVWPGIGDHVSELVLALLAVLLRHETHLVQWCALPSFIQEHNYVPKWCTVTDQCDGHRTYFNQRVTWFQATDWFITVILDQKRSFSSPSFRHITMNVNRSLELLFAVRATNKRSAGFSVSRT
jgi:hypothetical protein